MRILHHFMKWKLFSCGSSCGSAEMRSEFPHAAGNPRILKTAPRTNTCVQHIHRMQDKYSKSTWFLPTSHDDVWKTLYHNYSKKKKKKKYVGGDLTKHAQDWHAESCSMLTDCKTQQREVSPFPKSMEGFKQFLPKSQQDLLLIQEDYSKIYIVMQMN